MPILGFPMSPVYPVGEHRPRFGEGCVLAPDAVVAGDVVMGRNCSVWFGAVVRGDVHWIRLGDEVNVQDGAVIHGTGGTAPASIGSRVSIGHRAIVHGCTLEDEVLVGMGSVILDGVVVRSGSLVAAGAVVLAGTEIEAGTVWAGVPARKVKDLDEAGRAAIAATARRYVELSRWLHDAAPGPGTTPSPEKS